MADNLEYVCKECGFNWITLNGEHEMCPKCHSTTIEYIGEVKDLDIDSILNHNKRMGDAADLPVEEDRLHVENHILTIMTQISLMTLKNAADIEYAKTYSFCLLFWRLKNGGHYNRHQ